MEITFFKEKNRKLSYNTESQTLNMHYMGVLSKDDTQDAFDKAIEFAKHNKVVGVNFDLMEADHVEPVNDHKQRLYNWLSAEYYGIRKVTFRCASNKLKRTLNGLVGDLLHENEIGIQYSIN